MDVESFCHEFEEIIFVLACHPQAGSLKFGVLGVSETYLAGWLR